MNDDPTWNVVAFTVVEFMVEVSTVDSDRETVVIEEALIETVLTLVAFIEVELTDVANRLPENVVADMWPALTVVVPELFWTTICGLVVIDPLPTVRDLAFRTATAVVLLIEAAEVLTSTLAPIVTLLDELTVTADTLPVRLPLTDVAMTLPTNAVELVVTLTLVLPTLNPVFDNQFPDAAE